MLKYYMVSYMYYIKRLFSMNYKKMFEIIDEVSKRSGKSKIFIFFDMIGCSIKYKSGYMDYYVFNFENIKSDKRKTFITRGINNKYLKTLNNRKYYELFDNKIKFNELFNEFIKRDYLDLENSTNEEFKTFIKKHPKFIAKPTNLQCGKGIEIIDTENKDIKHLKESLIKNNQLLLEEIVIQTNKMNDLFPKSVNTLRIVTALVNNKCRVLFRVIRIGNGNNVVDNFNHGGMYSTINEKGVIDKPAIDKKGNIFEKHPITGTKIVGFEIPYFNEAIQMVKNASFKVKEVGLVGWDIAITDKGPVMIEGNQLPGYDVYQSKIHLNEDGTGLKPLFDKVIYNRK